MRSLSVLLVIILISPFWGISQPCLPQGITFYTQAQVDNFQVNHPNCTQIEGDVGIWGYEINNLDSLIVLTSIGGDLNIYSNASNNHLTNLSGLDNVNSIGGNLKIDRMIDAINELI